MRQGSGRIKTDGLIVYYDPINNERCYSGGGTASNLVSNFNNGSLLNAVGYDGLAFSFDGLNDRITIDATSELKSLQTPMTIMGWFNNDGLTNLPTIFGQYINTTPSLLIKLVRLDNNKLNYYCSENFNGYQQFTVNSIGYNYNEWNFFSVVMDGNTTTGSVSLTLNETTEIYTYFNLAFASTFVECRIGMPQNGNSQEYYTGKISTFMIYNRALSQDEVNYTYDITKSKFGK